MLDVQEALVPQAKLIPMAADTVLQEFLRLQKALFIECCTEGRSGAQIDLYMGNESADLDSLTSSVAAAFIFHGKNGDAIVLPLINMKRADFSAKKDLVLAAASGGFSSGDLVFIDDLAGGRIPQNARLHLVDHNCLTQSQAPWAEQVVEVIDHHKDSGRYSASDREGTFKKTIDSVGSCASLVVREASSPEQLPESVRLLIAHTICIDTVGFTAPHTTENDKRAFNQVIGGINYEIPVISHQLQQARADISGLSFSQVLAKDIKYYDGYWIASIPLGLDYTHLMQSPGAPEAVTQLLAGYKFGMVLSWLGDRRMLSIYFSTDKGSNPFEQLLISKGVELTPLQVELDGQHYSIPQNWNRKTLQPIVDLRRDLF